METSFVKDEIGSLDKTHPFCLAYQPDLIIGSYLLGVYNSRQNKTTLFRQKCSDLLENQDIWLLRYFLQQALKPQDHNYCKQYVTLKELLVSYHSLRTSGREQDIF